MDDNEGNKFYGKTNLHDEWITLWSPKIAKLGNASWIEYYQGLEPRKLQIDDSHDSKYGKKKNQFYAVLRPKLNTSSLLIDCLNLFGSEGGFDRILDMLISKTSIDFDFLILLLKCFRKTFYMYHKEFIRKFAPSMTDTIQSLIFK